MNDETPHRDRRAILRGLAVAGITSLLGPPRPATGTEPPPETTTIRLIHDPEIPVLCYAPVYVAEELLRGEGFTDVRYVKMVGGSEAKTIVAGHADMSGVIAAALILAVDARQPLVALAGLHIGCLELKRELKG